MRPHLDMRRWRWAEELLDGTRILIRPIRKDDARRECEFLECLSEEYKSYRFLDVAVKPITPEIIKRLTDLDFHQEVALIALTPQGKKDVEIGVSRYCVNRDGESCQCSVTVCEKWQHRGVGTLLMHHLMEVAWDQGIQRMYAVDHPANCKRRHVLALRLGFVSRPDPEDPVAVTYECRLQ